MSAEYSNKSIHLIPFNTSENTKARCAQSCLVSVECAYFTTASNLCQMGKISTTIGGSGITDTTVLKIKKSYSKYLRICSGEF